MLQKLTVETLTISGNTESEIRRCLAAMPEFQKASYAKTARKLLPQKVYKDNERLKLIARLLGVT